MTPQDKFFRATFSSISILGMLLITPIAHGQSTGCGTAMVANGIKDIVCPGIDVSPKRQPTVPVTPTVIPKIPLVLPKFHSLKKFNNPNEDLLMIAPPVKVDFRNMPTNLVDCDVVFDQLKAKAPSCKSGPLPQGRRCEQYSSSQFPEVVHVTFDRGLGPSLCTGTLISEVWVLTAAHCFMEKEATSARTGAANVDYFLNPNEVAGVRIYAANAITLSEAESLRHAADVRVYHGYVGLGLSEPHYDGDLALIRLASPYPAHAVEPALLAQVNDVNIEITIAGYGYTNAGGGRIDEFNLTWPVPILKTNDVLQFNPQSMPRERSAFCHGDSGGPVFAGRARGCYASHGERRPRLIQGTISHLYPPEEITSASKTAISESTKCLAAKDMRMQYLSGAAVRGWICRATDKTAKGC